MALRHLFPQIDVQPDLHLSDPMRTPPRVPKPVAVEFRTGADLGDVVMAIRDNRYVQIDAAVGTGKSVRVPSLLSQALGKLVVHVVPHQLLARDLHRYVSSITDVPTQRVVNSSDFTITSGLVFMHTAAYVAMVASRGEKDIPSHVLFMDEAHESDGATTALRLTALSKVFVERLVLASATANPEGFRRRETAGSVEVIEYDPDRLPSSWDVNEEGQPWNVDNLNDHTYMAVERDADARRLMADYRDHGFNCFRLTARTTEKEYDDINAMLADPRHGIVLLFVDYSFRSGFTKPIANAIDGGEVGYVTVVGSTPQKHYRRTYAGEQEQFVGRVGRLPGSQAKAYVPAGLRETKICDVEGVESDAAALLLRYMGYKPPAVMRSSPMFSGDVPRDLTQSLNGPVPLRCLPTEAFAAWPGVLSRDAVNQVDMRTQDDEGLKVVEQRSRATSVAQTPVSGRATPDEAGGLRGKAAAAALASEAHERFYGNSGTDRVQESLDKVSQDLSNLTASASPQTSGFVFHEQKPTPPMASTVVFERSDGTVKETLDPVLLFEQMLDNCDDVATGVEIGKYYHYPGATGVVDRSLAFPKGLQSIMSCALREDFSTVAKGLSVVDQLYAINVVLSAYNGATAELAALRRIISALPEYREKFNTIANRNAIREWLSGIAETLTLRGSHLSEYSRVMVALADEPYTEISGMADVENAVVDSHLSQLVQVIRESDEVAMTEYRQNLLQNVSPTVNTRLTSSTRFLEPGGKHVNVRTDSHVRRMLAPGKAERPKSEGSIITQARTSSRRTNFQNDWYGAVRTILK